MSLDVEYRMTLGRAEKFAVAAEETVSNKVSMRRGGGVVIGGQRKCTREDSHTRGQYRGCLSYCLLENNELNTDVVNAAEEMSALRGALQDPVSTLPMRYSSSRFCQCAQNSIRLPSDRLCLCLLHQSRGCSTNGCFFNKKYPDYANN